MPQGDQRKLLTVEDTLFIEGRGVIVLPEVPDYTGPRSFSVMIRKPSGDEVLAQATVEHLLLSASRLLESLVVMLRGLTKEDVPIGTEIWTVDQSTLPVA